MNYLFEKELKTDLVYGQNIAFFSNIISDINAHELPRYYDIKMENINELKKENPIFICKYNWRTLKIIQSTARSNSPIINTSFESTKDLVLQLELSEEILPTLKLFIRMWLVEKISTQGMNTIIDFASKKFLINNFENAPLINVDKSKKIKNVDLVDCEKMENA